MSNDETQYGEHCLSDVVYALGCIESELTSIREKEPDISLLDHFAGLAMQALLSRGEDRRVDRGDPSVEVAGYAYFYAEAMLAERERRMGK